MKNRGTAGQWVLLSGVLLTNGTIGCGEVEPSDLEGRFDESLESLYYDSQQLWGTKVVNVCFENGPFTSEKQWLRHVIKGQRSWEDAGKVVFTGFGTCSPGQAGIHVTFEASSSSWCWDVEDGVVDMHLASGTHLASACPSIVPALNSEQCFKRHVLHEFGHAIGLDHEEERPDKPTDCTAIRDGHTADTMWGPFDYESIMIGHGGTCQRRTDLSGLDRTGVDLMYGRREGQPARLGDYNGDTLADLLCHQAVIGGKSIDYANSSGQYNGQDYLNLSNWCGHDTGKVFTGKFNNDSSTDLLCHDVTSGAKWVDYASSGQFAGTEWSTNANWCSHDTGELHVGDFNNDGRDDLICHDTANGSLWVDYASSSGQFGGTDWSKTGAWCSQPTRRFHIGNFDGVNGDDLLCHDVSTGTKWLDYSNSSGQFGGTDWSTSANWCGHPGGELFVGDFNGDNRDDLLCHDAVYGYRWVDYASSSGRFEGTDFTSSSNWCYGVGRVSVGRINNDARDDLLCHHMKTGEKWVDYASSSGQFGDSDWYVDWDFCMADYGLLR